MLDHISIGVKDLARARRFYDAALAPLGCGLHHETADTLGYGPGEVRYWISQVVRPVPADHGSGLHICFTAPSKDAVQAFHVNGLAAGGTDNGGPGPRPDYGPNYYAAFVIDPDGYRLEAHYGKAD